MREHVSRSDAVKAMQTVIEYIGYGHLDEHTEGTAERYIKAWEQDWGVGYAMDFNLTTFKSGCDAMVTEINIPVHSHCAHHLAPIVGVAHIAYLPKDSIVGLSKLNRTVEMFARRLQVQERMTEQIANYLQRELRCYGVGVQIVAEHMCVSSRGVRHHNAKTVTTALTGAFYDAQVKEEFFDAIKSHTR